MKTQWVTTAPNSCPREFASHLLNQQIYGWGQDVKRPSGNWLLELGFHRQPPPDSRKNCSSVYSLVINAHTQIVLRGFGVYYGDDRYGGVFVERYGFSPMYLKDADLACGSWSSEDRPGMPPPHEQDRAACVMLLLGLTDWIRNYETTVISRLGLSYRQKTLTQWNNGERPFIPPEQMASAWRRLSFQIAGHSDLFLVN